MTRPTPVDISYDQYNQGLHCYSFIGNLDRHNAGVILLMLHTAKHIQLIKQNKKISVFKMTTKIHESKTLEKHISCEYECKIDGTKRNSNQKWKSNFFDVSVYIIYT